MRGHVMDARFDTSAGGRAGGRVGLFAAVLVLVGGCVCAAESTDVGLQRSVGDYSRLVGTVTNLLLYSQTAQDPGVRQDLIRALGETRDPAAYGVLVRVLEAETAHPGDFYGGEWQEAAYALARIGKPSIPDSYPPALVILKKAAAAGRLDRHQLLSAAGVLAANSGEPEALEFVQDVMFNDSDAAVRSTAVRAFSTGSGDKAKVRAGVLKRVAESDDDARVRATAACELAAANYGKTDWVAMKKISADEDVAVRRVVATLPYRDEIAPILLGLLEDRDEEVSGAAWETLEKHYELGTSPPHDGESKRELMSMFREAWERTRRR